MNVGVNLPQIPQATSASGLFQSILATAAEANPALTAALEGINKSNFGERLIAFEAARAGLAAPVRVDVAETLTALSAERLVYAREDGTEVRLSQYMEGSADPLPTHRRILGGSVGVVPVVPYEGRNHVGREIAGLAEDFLRRATITKAAGSALEWVASQRAIDLRDHKFVMIGAGAELAPTEILLRAGATVLFLDKASAEKYVADRSIQSGTLVYPREGADVLAQPLEIVATIERFAQGRPVHIGQFAYVGGKAREWRLTAAMNAIVRRLDPAIVGSVGLYVSPTAPAEAQPEDATASLAGFANPSLSDRAWKGLGVLKRNLHRQGDSLWPRNVVSLQGLSYLAAQYIEKRAAAEVFATRGTRRGGKPVVVSANVAGITRTRSMQIPTFQAGFLGAPSLGLETYEPETTRWLSGLLYLEGILNPLSVGARNPFEDENVRAQRLSSVQVHGAVYSHPYAVEGAITRAALIGLRKKPGLIPGFVRSLTGK